MILPRHRLIPLLGVLGLTATMLAAPASASPMPPTWSALSPADRDALIQPIAERWDRATPEQRQRMLERARLWASLSPEQKALARQGMTRYREASAERRGQLREVWQQLQSLPPDEREALRATWRRLTPAERRAWLEAGGPGKAPPPRQP